MPRERIEQLHRTFGSILVQGLRHDRGQFAGRRADQGRSCESAEWRRPELSACGRPVFGCELRVVDDNGRAVGDGEIGEIVFRSPGSHRLLARYERTQAAIQNGWLHSGDLATVDSEGYIYIVDRKSDIIISGGFNVSRRKFEEIIGWHPGVREAAVVARPIRNGARRCMPSWSCSRDTRG